MKRRYVIDWIGLDPEIDDEILLWRRLEKIGNYLKPATPVFRLAEIQGGTGCSR